MKRTLKIIGITIVILVAFLGILVFSAQYYFSEKLTKTKFESDDVVLEGKYKVHFFPTFWVDLNDATIKSKHDESLHATIGKMYIAFDVFPLFKKRFHVRKVLLENSKIRSILMVPTREDDSPLSSQKQQSKSDFDVGWSLIIDDVTVVNTQLSAVLPKSVYQVDIKKLQARYNESIKLSFNGAFDKRNIGFEVHYDDIAKQSHPLKLVLTLDHFTATFSGVDESKTTNGTLTMTSDDLAAFLKSIAPKRKPSQPELSFKPTDLKLTSQIVIEDGYLTLNDVKLNTKHSDLSGHVKVSMQDLYAELKAKTLDFAEFLPPSMPTLEANEPGVIRGGEIEATLSADEVHYYDRNDKNVKLTLLLKDQVLSLKPCQYPWQHDFAKLWFSFIDYPHKAMPKMCE